MHIYILYKLTFSIVLEVLEGEVGLFDVRFGEFYTEALYTVYSRTPSLSSNFQQSRDRRQQISLYIFASEDYHRASRVQINEKASTVNIQ
jgi:hypothetical protein